MLDTASIIGSLLPQKVLKPSGEAETFDVEKITSSLVNKAEIAQNLANAITTSVISKLAAAGNVVVTATYLKELIGMELVNRGYTSAGEQFLKHAAILDKFCLDQAFLKQFIGKQPDWGPLGYITYKRTYARTIDGENRSEEFWETLQRVVEGCFTIQKQHCHRLGLPWIEDKGQRSAQLMFNKMWHFKFLAPGRGLWIMGTPYMYKHGSMALNNCGFVSTEDIAIKGSIPFEWVMDALMLGVGVGFDTKGAGKITIREPHLVQKTYQIPDSREGWVQSLGIVLRAYFLGADYPSMDYSLIRPAGMTIKGFGGIASGPDPLAEMLTSINDLLFERIGKSLRAIDIVDIFNLIGKCVVAGNVRRSAEIAIGPIDDPEYITMKQDEALVKSHRWVSNNSVVAKAGSDYRVIIPSITKNGEPGILWMDTAKAYSRLCDSPDYKDRNAAGVNPCGEQTLESYELCCLVETFPSRHESYAEFKETLKMAYLYAKSVTLMNTHWQVTNAVMGKNRRIGTSQSGIIDAFARHGRRTMIDWCKQGYAYLQELDKIYSDWLCVPRSIKITSVKPSGTVSLLPGVTPGIHYPHAEYYIRRIRIAENSPLVSILRQAGYPVEKDAYSANTLVASFPVHEQYFARDKKSVTIWEQLANAADYQRFWADNAVSITVTFQPAEADQLLAAIECYEDKLKGVTFLPMQDHGFTQPPYETISRDTYEKMVAQIKPMVLSQSGSGVRFCDGETCAI